MAVAIILFINIIGLAIYYWMKAKQKDRRTYYTDRFDYIRNELLERLRR